MIEILKGKFDLIFSYLYWFLLIIIIAFLLLIFQWKIGLKKYEAFG